MTKITPIVALDLERDVLADLLVRAYLKQIVIDGVFRADPHPGNVLVTDDGFLALIDLGMIGRIGHQSIADFQIGKVFRDLSALINANNMRAPAELTMLGKTLMHLDEVARALDPNLDVNEAIRRNGVDLMSKRMRKVVTSGSVIASVLEAKEFAAKLPGRVNRVLDSLAASELKLKVELIDDGAIIDGLQKVANRITLGLILAAMIVSAAMVMSIDTTFRIMGYPGFAIILFTLAFAGAAYLAVQIVRHDRTVHHR